MSDDNEIVRLVTKKEESHKENEPLVVFDSDDDFITFSTFALNEVEVKDIKGAVSVVLFDRGDGEDVIFAKAHSSEHLLALIGVLNVMKSTLLGEINLVGGLDEKQ